MGESLESVKCICVCCTDLGEKWADWAPKSGQTGRPKVDRLGARKWKSGQTGRPKVDRLGAQKWAVSFFTHPHGAQHLPQVHPPPIIPAHAPVAHAVLSAVGPFRAVGGGVEPRHLFAFILGFI